LAKLDPESGNWATLNDEVIHCLAVTGADSQSRGERSELSRVGKYILPRVKHQLVVRDTKNFEAFLWFFCDLHDYSHRNDLVSELNRLLDDPSAADLPQEAKQKLAWRQSRIVSCMLQSFFRSERVWGLLRQRPDPTLRTYLIHDSRAHFGFFDRTMGEKDSSIKQALVLALGEPGPALERLRPVPSFMLREYREHPDSGVHAGLLPVSWSTRNESKPFIRFSL
jgi:hypothetical protein